MTLILNGTTGLSDVDGTAAAPAIRGTDADTGLYFPTANEVAAAAGGVAVWNAASTFGFKNRIINGAMMIDQRNAGASVTLSGTQTFPVDRLCGFEDTDGTMTAQRSTTAPVGFTNSVVFTTGTADASLGATQFAIAQQRIEGFNIADLGWGTANAATVTLSFWVRSSLTGTFGGALRNSAFDRGYPFTYTISSANTFEYKTITIPGDTTGTWLTDNGSGILVTLGLGVGSTYSGTAGAWAAGSYLSATGAVSVVGTAGATFYITGVQFEKGSTATSFDFRDYGTELLRCQRYYVRWGTTDSLFAGGASSDGGSSRYVVNLPVQMRSTVANNCSANGAFSINDNAASVTSTGFSFTSQTSQIFRFNLSHSALGAYRPVIASIIGSNWIEASAEL